MSSHRYVLCRPMGGLNDIFSQIEKCCRYAERTGRRVIVDTAYPGIDFGIPFSQIFLSRQEKLHLDIETLSGGLSNLSVYPNVLQGRLQDYVVKRIPPAPYVEKESEEPIQFDFTKSYSEEILVHHQLGRWPESAFLFLRLGLRQEVITMLLERLREIGGPYVGLHVRHTDYQSNYGDLFDRLKNNPPQRILLATDNQLVLDTCRDQLAKSEIFSFTQNLSVNGQPIHMADSQLVSPMSRNRDALIDLMLLALAQSLYVAPLTGRTGWSNFPKYSGFSTLAMRLNQTRILLDYFLRPLQTMGGLGWRDLRVS